MQPLILTCAAAIAGVCFYSGDFFSIPVSVALALFAGGSVLLSLQRRRVGFLAAFLAFVYVIPFIHIVPYLWFDFESSPDVLWGLAVNPYMLDQKIIEATAMLGLIGLLGIAVGSRLGGGKIVRDSGLTAEGLRLRHRTMLYPMSLIWLIIGTGLSWISAPRQTIFEAAYTDSESLHAGMNFSSAWMMSYVVLTFVVYDALLDHKPERRLLKVLGASLAVGFVVIWLQLLRGDRESLPWIFALAIGYFYWGGAFFRRNVFKSFPVYKLVTVAITLLIGSLVIGNLRSAMAGGDILMAAAFMSDLISSSDLSAASLFYGTWSAVLLTPLSVSGDYVNGILHYKFGQDYADLLLSLPPGFVADWFNYERPLSGDSSLAWEMRYGIGGTHASVAPFVNFGVAGVFCVCAGWALFFSRCEKRILRKISVINISFLVTVAMAAPMWLWYGEKSIVNAIIMWVILAMLYRFSISIAVREKP